MSANKKGDVSADSHKCTNIMVFIMGVMKIQKEASGRLRAIFERRLSVADKILLRRLEAAKAKREEKLRRSQVSLRDYLGRSICLHVRRKNSFQ